MTADERFPLHDGDQTGDGPEQGGLASAVRPAEQHDLTRADIEVEAGESGEAAEQADGSAEADDRVHEDRGNGTGGPESRPRRVIRGIGKTLIVAGTVVLLFVAYLLWGTGLHEARAQDSLKKQFERSLAETTATTVPSAGGTTSTTVPTPPPTGNAVAVIRIPKIGVEKAVVEGVSVPDLQKGPGHYPGTPLPGQPGNASIAGHRTTYGAPFYDLDQLVAGDEIDVTTLQGTYRFVIDRTEVVRPDQVEVIAPTLDSRITLTTCNPRFSSRERLIVSAVLVGEPAPTATTTSTTPPAGSTDDPDSDPAAALDEPTLSSGGEHAARVPSALWAAACVLVAVGVHQLAKRRQRWRRLGVYVIGAVPVGLALFVFFENVSRLLPANF